MKDNAKDEYDELYVGYLSKNAGESVQNRKLLRALEKFTTGIERQS